MAGSKSLYAALISILTVFGAVGVESQEFSFEERREIARRITESMQYIKVDAVESPEIEDLSPMAIFWIRNNEDNGYTYAFESGDYTFEIYDPEGQGVGPYLCAAAEEFDRQRYRLEPRFLRDVEIGVTAGAGRGDVSVGVNIDGLEGMVREIFAAARGLGDWVLGKEDARFLILIRGHADAGPLSRSLQAAPNDYHRVEALPPSPNDPTGLNLYLSSADEFTISDPYSNSDLPLLRARFIRQLTDAFGGRCVEAPFETRVLQGTTVQRAAPQSLRKVDLYLYAY